MFYGTDRARGNNDKPENYYTGKRGFPAFGIAQVSVPIKGGDRSALPGPSWWRLQFKPNPAKHVILTSVYSLGRDTFVDELRASLASADVRDALASSTATTCGSRMPRVEPHRSPWTSSLKAGRFYIVGRPPPTRSSTRRMKTQSTGLGNTSRSFCTSRLPRSERDVHVIAHSIGNRSTHEYARAP